MPMPTRAHIDDELVAKFADHYAPGAVRAKVPAAIARLAAASDVDSQISPRLSSLFACAVEAFARSTWACDPCAPHASGQPESHTSSITRGTG
jgi:hypothetical protein